MKYTEVNRRKRGKRKRKYYLLKTAIAVLALFGLYQFAMSPFFAIDRIVVQDNAHFTAAQVAELSGVKKGDNIFKTRTGIVKEQLEADPYIRSVLVERELPDGIRITVEERSEDVLVRIEAENGPEFAAMCYDGVVLRTGALDEKPILPEIDGLTPLESAPGKPMKVKEASMLKPSLDFFRTVQEHDFYVMRLDVSGVLMKAYIFEHLVCEGELKNLSDNIDGIRSIVADLNTKGIERGTISVSGTGTCSFKPEGE
jgi:cell division protein FtsQ